MVQSITVRNFRCFGEEAQKARLAPLTILVGENSSGKTSLMALIRALWDVAFKDRVPDFKEAPYDLGSFREIAHHRGARGSRADTFEARFEIPLRTLQRNSNGLMAEVTVSFREQWSVPMPELRRLSQGQCWIAEHLSGATDGQIEFGSARGEWRLSPRLRMEGSSLARSTGLLSPFGSVLFGLRNPLEDGDILVEPLGESPDVSAADVDSVRKLVSSLHFGARRSSSGALDRPFASAPVRSEPQRTSDPRQLTADALGDYVPSYLAQLSRRDPKAWAELKARLEDFGHDSGLFDEIRVRHLGKTDADPFQLQVRKFAAGAKGPFRSLVDVGYGVSQVLPVALEVLRSDAHRFLLLQQPEVHLHPSAQASLGTLLCSVAGRSKGASQIIVETHSDYIVDRVRMAVADSSNPLEPNDVSIVFFERCGLEVRLHSISIDETGCVIDAPQGYRQFFFDEIQRSVGF